MAKIRKFGAFALIMLFGLGFCSKAAAQMYIEEPRTFYGGLLAGANFTQVDGDSYAGYHKVGINVGGIVYTRLAEHLAASIEILYSQKGSRGHKTQLTNNGTIIRNYSIDLNYAEVPIQLNYFDKRKSHFGAGFSYSQLISAEENLETNPPHNLNLEDFPFRKMDINFILGGNLHLWKGLFLNARFQYSLIPIRTKAPSGFGRANEQFSNVWTLRLMYLFQ